MKTGAFQQDSGSVIYRVWAPLASKMALHLVKRDVFYKMEQEENGYFAFELEKELVELDYFFQIEGKIDRPDPASRWQPEGVHGPSRLLSPQSFTWEDENWGGLDLKDMIFYELHVGTFTEEGTFEGVISKLPYLKELGITAIEIMPVSQFPGERNWGYDGVFPYAVQNTYGGPNALKKLVNACHKENIAVVLDVVYNHLGPEGNYLADFGPYFTKRYQTPWGLAINFDGKESGPVRQFFSENALFWLTEYHIDGLRLDAIHAIYDFSAKHFLYELSEAFHKKSTDLKRKACLIAESDLNDVRIIQRKTYGGYEIDAQWSDDFHHSVIAFLAKEKRGYFADFGSLAEIAKAIKEGFVNDGRYSAFRKRTHGNSSKNIAGERLVICLENHDQIANAFRGDRLSQRLTLEQQKVAALLLFTAPNLPLLFMGQEWSETNPFLYFTSHKDKELIEAVRVGYALEMASYDFYGKEIDPQDEMTFHQSKLDWDKLQKRPHKELLQFYKDVIKLRKQLECLNNCQKENVSVNYSEKKRFLTLKTKHCVTVFNLSEKESEIAVSLQEGNWTCLLDTTLAIYGGSERKILAPSVQSTGQEVIKMKSPGWSGRLLFNSKGLSL